MRQRNALRIQMNALLSTALVKIRKRTTTAMSAQPKTDQNTEISSVLRPGSAKTRMATHTPTLPNADTTSMRQFAREAMAYSTSTMTVTNALMATSKS